MGAFKPSWQAFSDIIVCIQFRITLLYLRQRGSKASESAPSLIEALQAGLPYVCPDLAAYHHLLEHLDFHVGDRTNFCACENGTM